MGGDESQGRADGQPDGQADSRVGGQPQAWQAVACLSLEALKPYHRLNLINITYNDSNFPTNRTLNELGIPNWI